MTQNEPAARHLICPNHGEERIRLEEDPQDDSIARCPNCRFACQNYIKYPVAQVMDTATGKPVMRNILTNEQVNP